MYVSVLHTNTSLLLYFLYVFYVMYEKFSLFIFYNNYYYFIHNLCNFNCKFRKWQLIMSIIFGFYSQIISIFLYFSFFFQHPKKCTPLQMYIYITVYMRQCYLYGVPLSILYVCVRELNFIILYREAIYNKKATVQPNTSTSRTKLKTFFVVCKNILTTHLYINATFSS